MFYRFGTMFSVSALCFPISALCFLPFRHYYIYLCDFNNFIEKEGSVKEGFTLSPIRPDGYPRLKIKIWYDGQKLGLHSRVLRLKSLSSRDGIVRKIEILIF